MSGRNGRYSGFILTEIIVALTILGILLAGLAFHTGRFKFSFAYVVQTMQFKAQNNYPVYGFLNMSLVLGN